MDNPFLFADDPYAHNPYIILGIKGIEKANAGFIDIQAERIENYAEKNVPCPETQRLEKRGVARGAATALKDPVLRLTFDLMRTALEIDREDMK